MEFQPSRRRRAAFGFVLTALGALGLVSALLLSSSGGRAAAQVPNEPVVFGTNKTCAELAPPGTTWTELKVDPVVSGPYTDGTLSVTVTVVDTPSGPTVNWTSNIDVEAVFVKGGPGGALYSYPGGSTSDTGLHAPVNPANGKYFGLSHLSFCYCVCLPTTTTTMATTTSKPHKTTTTMATTTTTMATTTTTMGTTTTMATTTTGESSTTTTPVTTPTTAAPRPPAPPELPATGRNMTPLLLASLAALGAGLGLIAASRRLSRT